MATQVRGVAPVGAHLGAERYREHRMGYRRQDPEEGDTMIVLSIGTDPAGPLPQPHDFVEWRLDTLPLNPLTLRKIRVPWIATARTAREGGQFRGSPGEKIRLLHEALRAGARWVDLEAAEHHADLPTEHLVRSLHLKDSAPGAQRAGLSLLQSAPGARLKWVRPVEEAGSLSPVERALLRSGRPVLLVHSGEAGQWTRLRPPGLAWSIAPLPGLPTGRGQVELADLAEGLPGPLWGITGWPVSHSLSPAFHNAELRRRKLKGLYLRFPARELGTFLQSDAGHHVQGLSVTAPHKVEALRHASTASACAQEAGAANTLVRRPSGWHAENTDALALKALLQEKGAKGPALVLGTGGLSRAACWALKTLGLTPTTVGRDTSGVRASDFSTVIQTTPAEMNGAPPPLGTAACRPDTLLVEGLYTVSTRFLSEAPASCPRITGQDLFAAQARLQAGLFFG
ncbi:MAG: type I 3-dehydroquinate dehydratase [Planctomycetota bacterium]